MEDGLAEAIDEGKIGPKDDPKVRPRAGPPAAKRRYLRTWVEASQSPLLSGNLVT
jgi:hypothetical protein